MSDIILGYKIVKRKTKTKVLKLPEDFINFLKHQAEWKNKN